MAQDPRNPGVTNDSKFSMRYVKEGTVVYPERNYSNKHVMDSITKEFPYWSEFGRKENVKPRDALYRAYQLYLQQSEFKKPYLPGGYPDMEVSWSPPNIRRPHIDGPDPGDPFGPGGPGPAPAFVIFDLNCNAEDEAASDQAECGFCPNQTVHVQLSTSEPVYWVQTTLTDDPATHLENIDGYGTNTVSFDLVCGEEAGFVTIEASMTSVEGLTGSSNVNLPEGDACTGNHFISFQINGTDVSTGTVATRYLIWDIDNGTYQVMTSAQQVAWYTGRGLSLNPGTFLYSTSTSPTYGAVPTTLVFFVSCSPPLAGCSVPSDSCCNVGCGGTKSYASNTKAAFGPGWFTGRDFSISVTCSNNLPGPTCSAQTQNLDLVSGSGELWGGAYVYNLRIKAWATSFYSGIYYYYSEETETYSLADYCCCGTAIGSCWLYGGEGNVAASAEIDLYYGGVEQGGSIISAGLSGSASTTFNTVGDVIGGYTSVGNVTWDLPWFIPTVTGSYRSYVSAASKFYTWSIPNDAGEIYTAAFLEIMSFIGSSGSSVSIGCGNIPLATVPDSSSFKANGVELSSATEGAHLDPYGNTTTQLKAGIEAACAELKIAVGGGPMKYTCSIPFGWEDLTP